MRYAFTIFLVYCSSILAGQTYQQIHQRAVVIDTHNDILSKAIEQGLALDEDLRGAASSDLNRFAAGGVDAQVFSIWCDQTYGTGTAFKRATQEIDTLYSWIKRNPNRMMLVKTPAELAKAVKQKKLGCMIGVEGGHMIEDDLLKLDSLYRRGAVYLTLTWNNSTSWASSAMDESQNRLPDSSKGLNSFGKELVKHLNDLGMMIDLSHVGEKTFWDVMAITKKPVLVSHSCAWAICPVFRNLKDDQIKAIGKNGGLIDVNFFSGFLDKQYEDGMKALKLARKNENDSLRQAGMNEQQANDWLNKKYEPLEKDLQPPLSLVLDHIDHIVQLIGVDHVGLGSDFDGISSSPKQLEEVSDFPNLSKALLERGYTARDVKKILGGNFIRVFKANRL